jgi:hypothetical protein
MGGEDVYDSLLQIRQAAEIKLKGRTEAVRKK